MSGLRLHFWDWKEPVLRHAVGLLLEGWSGGVLDLSDRVLLVPTAETGRRLREALAKAVAEKEGVVTAPYVWSPEVALMSGADRTKIAQPLQERLAWMAVLEKLRADEVQALLPVFDGRKDEGWQAGMAESLSQLKRTLGAGGLDMQSVVDVLREGDERDVERWLELAALEKRYLAKLGQMGLRDVQNAKRDAVKAVEVPAGVKWVQVFALPDPPALLRQWLEQVAKLVPVEVFVHAAAEAWEMFDELGTPRGESWGQTARPLLPLVDEDLAMEGTPAEQAAKMVQLLREMALQGMNVAVGSADLKVNAPLEAVLAAEGVQVYDPAGHGAQGHPLLVVLRAWLGMLRSGLWKDLAAFLRIADVLRVVRSEELRSTGLLRALDDLHEQHLPATLEEALGLCDKEGLKAVLAMLQQRVRVWEGASASVEGGLRDVLDWIYGEREFDTSQHEDGDHAKLMGDALGLAAALDAMTKALGVKVSAAGLLAIVLDEMSSASLADVRGEVDLVLHGWLELPWEPARGLVIAGFNEESVPGIVTGDAFLPDGLRKRLGLACQASRRARDAYLLRAMAEQRREGGSLKLVLGRVNEQGEGLRPSRLLFDCADAALVQRVRKLFPTHDVEGDAEGRVPPRSVAFLLKPRMRPTAVERVSPSMLRSYLICPFQFYLKQVLKMQPVEAGLNEATPMVFGTLVHEVLQRYAESKVMQECVDGAAVARWLDVEVEKVWKKQFGSSPLLSVVMQMETARQRLLAVAESLAELRAKGWRTVHVEQRVVDWGLEIGGLPFSGKIDRVDRRMVDGCEEFLLLDYKTGKATDPVKSHLTRIKDEDAADERVAWQCYEEMGSKWVDLQLPLYAWALREKYAGKPVSVGYFHLPVMVSDAGLRFWEGLDGVVIGDALRCAEEAVRRIREGDFWPPAEEVKYQDYAFLLGDAQTTIDATELLQGREVA